MNILAAVGATLGIIGFLGGAAAWFKRSEGLNTISLLKTNIESYKTSESQHLQEIAELKASNLVKDKALAEARSTIKTIIKEFKEYKNGT